MDIITTHYWLCGVGGSALLLKRGVVWYLAHRSRLETTVPRFRLPQSYLSPYAAGAGLWFAIFGWLGLALYTRVGLLHKESAYGGCVGALSVVILFLYLHRRWSPRFAASTKGMVDKSAVVYERIPEDGPGIVHVTVNKIVYEVRAKSSDRRRIEPGNKVIIRGVIDSETLRVARPDEY